MLELSGSTDLHRTRQWGTAATHYCKPNSQSNSLSCIHSFGTGAIGRASYAISARRAGEVIVDSRMQLLRDDTVLEVNRDITQFKALEQRLRSVAAIVESSDDAIVSENLDGVITETGTREPDVVFGYSAEEAIGQPITIVIPEEQHP